jgi:hypothetical protein
MKASEATRVLNTARKHGEEVVELGIELIDMLAETYDSEINSMKLECENQLNEAKQVIAELEKKVDDAQSFAARVDCSLELEAVQKENERLKAELQAMRKCPGQTPEQPKPRRGRPPKNKDAVRSLAEELASMAPKD